MELAVIDKTKLLEELDRWLGEKGYDDAFGARLKPIEKV